MIKHPLLFSLAVFASLFTQVSITEASPTPSVPPLLMRSAEQSAVYYALNDGRRYAFPNQSIYGSWYSSFDAVQVVSASNLASYRLAGVVLYRPGSLIKIATDPKVYLVTNNGELRWIETEEIALGLFGTTWARQVQDVSDAFFFSYHLGQSVHSAIDVSLNALLADVHAASISGNQELVAATTFPTPPPVVTTSSRDIVLQSSLLEGIRLNESATIDVYADQTIPSSTVIRVNGTVAQTCQRSAKCSYTLSHFSQTSVTSYVIVAEANYGDGPQKTKTYTIPVVDMQAGALRQTVSLKESRPQGSVDIHTTWSDQIVRPYRISLLVNGYEQKVCYSTITCDATYGIDAAVGTNLAITSVAEDTAGQTWRTVTSTVAIVANPKPVVSVGSNGPVLYTGEVATVSAQADDEDGIAFIEIWQGTTRVARCERPTCSYTSSAFTQSGSTQFRVIAQDLRGARQEIDLRPMLVVSNPS